MTERYTAERPEADIDALAQNYLGADRYPRRATGERRITVPIEPKRVHSTL